MSYGCGSMAGPSGYKETKEKAASPSKGINMCKGTGMAARGNGNQHTIPEKAKGHWTHKITDEGRKDKRMKGDDVEAHWHHEKSVNISVQPKGPTRVWGSVKANLLGGEERVDGKPDRWAKGEYWNVDSNIRIWGEHEIKRNAAEANHDVMRHEQIRRPVVVPHPRLAHSIGVLPKPYQKHEGESGAFFENDSFLSMHGFPLGQRDRGKNHIARIWNPVNSSEMFRAERSYDRDYARMTENHRSLRRINSDPVATLPLAQSDKHHLTEAATVEAEDIGGEAGTHRHETEGDISKMGRTHGSRSCIFWNKHDHAAKREAAKLSCGNYSPFNNGHSESYPFKDHLELNPASVYSLKCKKWGEAALRDHVQPSDRTTKGSLTVSEKQWKPGERAMASLKRSL